MCGDPTKGTHEKGKWLFGVAVNTIVTLIQDYHSGKLEDALAWNVTSALKKGNTPSVCSIE